MPLAARLESVSRSFGDKRREPRLQLSLRAAVGERGSTARIHDISTRGLLFETSAELSAGLVEVQLPHSPPAQARIVWSHGRFFGCEFVDKITPAAVSAALLLGQPIARPAEVPIQAKLEPSGAETGHLAWLKLAIAASLALAGAAYLVATGHIVALAIVGVASAALAVLALLVVNWALDNSSTF